ncbi:MAG: glycosyltransferase [Nitrospirota bacterium]
MKILLSVPGHLKTVPMNDYVFRTLKEMGHEVRLFNFGAHGFYQQILKKISEERFFSYINRKVEGLVNNFRPDVFFTICGFDHGRTSIEYIKNKCVLTICWWLNDPFQLKRSLRQAAFYDYYFTNSKGTIKDYYANNIKNVFYLPVGCYPPVHRKLMNEDNRYDVCFAGDWHHVREEILSSLAQDFDVSIFGPWKKKINKNSHLTKNVVRDGFFSPEEMVNIFNQSKIILNIHTWLGKWDYGINPRIFEANGCGAFQVSDYKEEIPELYEPEREIVLYKNTGELREKISFFLTHDKERIDIAEKGLLKTLRYHTYEQRLREMFQIARLE